MYTFGSRVGCFVVGVVVGCDILSIFGGGSTIMTFLGCVLAQNNSLRFVI